MCSGMEQKWRPLSMWGLGSRDVTLKMENRMTKSMQNEGTWFHARFIGKFWPMVRVWSFGLGFTGRQPIIGSVRRLGVSFFGVV